MNEAVALFTTKENALRHGVLQAKRKGVPSGVILAKTRVHPIVKRGELKGYQCRYPVSANVTYLVMEHQV